MRVDLHDLLAQVADACPHNRGRNVVRDCVANKVVPERVAVPLEFEPVESTSTWARARRGAICRWAAGNLGVGAAVKTHLLVRGSAQHMMIGTIA